MATSFRRLLAKLSAVTLVTFILGAFSPAFATCTATFTLTPVGTNGFKAVIFGQGNCYANGNNGGPVRLYYKKPGHDWSGEKNCPDGPCTKEIEEAIPCADVQEWSAKVECYTQIEDGCIDDAPAIRTASASLSHNNSLHAANTSKYLTGGGIYGVAGIFHVRAPDAWTARVIHYTWLLADGGSASAGSDQAVGAPQYDEVDVPFGGYVPPAKGATLIATLDSCGDRFSSVALDTSGDHSCDISNRPPAGCPCVGEPIRLDDGNMQITQVDPLPAFAGAAMKRTYNSDGPSTTWFGAGWSSMFDRALYVYPYVLDGPWAVIWLDGTKRYVFQAVQGNYVQAWPLGTQRATLTVDPVTGAYTLREPGEDIEIVMEPDTGLPVFYRSRSTGRTLAISYSGTTPVHVSDSWETFGWTITSNQHQIQSITIDGTSLAWQYVYTGGILTAVNGPGGGPWRSYTYSGNHLTEARDSAGKLLESHSYNNFGRATTSLQREGDIQAIDYGVATRNNTFDTMTRVTSATGAVTNYWLSYVGGRVRVVEIQGACASCGTNDAVFAYRPADYGHPGGELLRMQDARGYVTEWTYDSADRVVSMTRGYKPGGCNPETDSSHCRQTPDGLRTIPLTPTAESETTSYSYANANWPDRPTTITRSSVASPGSAVTQTLTYDTATGTVLTDTMHGHNGTASETHVTTTVLYAVGEPAAFNPGGAFNAAWLSLPQPNGLRKSVDGPRTDVADVTQWVYYPIAAAVPQFWRSRVAAVRDAIGHVTRFESYDVFGNPTRVVDANGVATEYTYDGSGRVLTSTVKGSPGCDTAADPLCATDLVTTRTYSAFGPLVSETRSNGATTTYEYDARGRINATTRPVSTSVSERIEYDYDPLTGKKSAERYLSGQPGSWTLARSEAFRYDIFGRLVAVDHPDGTSVGYAYDGANNIVSVKDENHATPNTTYKYDPENRLIRVTQTLSTAAGGAINTEYAYDLHGNLTSVVDPNGNATTYQFDDFGHMRQQASPVSGITAYAYDLGGNLISTTDASGATTTRSYDPLSRVTSAVSSRSSQSETVSWTYDDATPGRFGIGRVASMTDPTGSTSYGYERRGLLRSEVKTVFGAPYSTSYTFDSDGNRASMTYPSGRVVNYGYDLAGRPVSAYSGATSFVTSATYLPFGPLKQLSYGNGTTKTMQYDARYRPLENKLTGPAGVIAEYDYAQDAVGNITQIHDAVDPAYNRDFGYDDLNRLTTANSGSALWGSGAFQYDRMGNMQSLSLGTSRSASFAYNGTLPKLASVTENGASRSVAYDAAGNETSVGSGSFTYTPRNSLESGDGFTYAYDGRGVRTLTSYPAYYISSLSLAVSTLYTNQSTSGTVLLGAPAPAGGATVQLSASSTAVLIPASVTIPAGGTSAVFGVNQAAGAQPGSVTITATYGFTRTAVLTLTAGPALSSVAIAPASVVGGNTATGTVTLAAAAPAGGAPVSLSSDSSAAAVPSSIAVAAGSTSATFTVTTSAVTTATTATVQAVYGNTATASLTVQPVALAALTVQPASIMGGNPVTGTVTLNGPAPVGGVAVTLTSANPQLVIVPAAVTVAAGSSSQTFPITTAVTSSDSAVVVTATLSGQSATATLTVTHCVVAHAAAPAIPGGDTVWIDETLPAGAGFVGGLLEWTTLQAAGGTKSVGEPYYGQTTTYASSIQGLNEPLAIGENAVFYLLINECAVPRELKVQWQTSAGYGIAWWGEALIGNEANGINMGPLPAAGSWVRIEIPLQQLHIEQRTLTSIYITHVGGQIWLDHIGKSGTGCTAAQATAPTIPSGDTVWIDETLPAGAGFVGGIIDWSTVQAAGGTKSLSERYYGQTTTYASSIQGLNEPLAIGENAVFYLLINECAVPRELKVQWQTSAGYGIAWWGEALIGNEANGINMGPLPAAGSWVRIEIPLQQLRIEQRTLTNIYITHVGGQIWLDHIGKSGTGCTAAQAAAPTIPSGDTVWIDEALPAGAGFVGGLFDWSTLQAAGGTKSLTERYYGQTMTYASSIQGLNEPLAIGENAVFYLLINECAVPRELKVQWQTSAGYGIAWWGEALIGNEANGINMGPLPAAGSWVRVEIPLQQLRIEQRTLTNIYITHVGGQIWLDHIGKSGTGCTAAHAAAPTIPGGDTVWIDDTLPAGAGFVGGIMDWTTLQAASGTKSLSETYYGQIGTFASTITGLNQPLAIGENAVFYLLVNECAVPRELKVQWQTSTGYGIAWWGEALIGNEANGINMGPLPAAGSWVRVEIPFQQLHIEQKTLTNIYFTRVGGQVWLDHIGKSGPSPAVLTSFGATPASPQAVGTSITFSATATAYVAPAQYRFERQDNGTWSTVQAYSATSSYTWTPASGDAGEHFVRVSVRNAGSLLDFEDTQTLAYTVTGGSGFLQNPEGRVLLALRRIFQRPEPPISLAVGSHLAIRTTSAPVGFNRYSLYTPELNLMAETETTLSSTPAVAHEYIWFAGQPVAQVDIESNTTHWTFTDHLGTPVLQTDAAGAIGWRAEQDPYGNAFTFRAGATRHQPLRFPGQEAEESSERSYNIFRWYRAGWGRYTQADPIGIRGGYNLYQYAASDPQNFSDPLGLEVKRCFRPFSNPRTRIFAGLLNVVTGFYAIQPPIPGVSKCLMHEYLFNTDTQTSLGFDPKEIVQETGKDICYTIPEPVGSCVWKNFLSTAGPMTKYNLFSNNCQTTVNETVKKCTPCAPKSPTAPTNCVVVDGKQVCGATGI